MFAIKNNNNKFMVTFLIWLVAILVMGGIVSIVFKLLDGVLSSFIVGCAITGPIAVLLACLIGALWCKPRWYVIALTIISFGLFSAFMFWGIAFFPEQVMIFNPDIDTEFASGYTEESFAKIKNGMTGNDVIRLLGPPLRVYQYDRDGRWPGNPSEVWFYTGDGACKWGDFAWKGRAICIHSNLVVGKWSAWCYD